VINIFIYDPYVFLPILTRIPVANSSMTKDDFPYEKNGRGIPVSGISPATALKFNITCRPIQIIIPNPSSLIAFDFFDEDTSCKHYRNKLQIS